ncbi:cyclin-dependent kinase inhibitor 7 [Ricinus communis]|uniref:Cyclin-dependent kinase inhibitor n=1 Tax=Ricinus communis TaxID=3988 RepID=B9SC41_RICCO|nr:cyclin-dependent kinase inhibitor 7 [Ricinus communis]EEF38755.1 conserved hypothetical protein [Ricinus communis]|eukprot:XP_002523560.1 cyclin-dependent kinase inhibitor 7 [Ricinus communis]
MMEMAKVGVRTRAQALALAAAASGSRKRKVNDNQRPVMNIELRRSTRRRITVATPENNSISRELNSGHRTASGVVHDRCSSPSLDDSDHACASCCSSNGSSQDDHGNIKFADLQDERSAEVETSVYYSCRERRESTPSSEVGEELSDELDSTARPSAMEANSRRKPSLTVEKMPTETELDEFFAEAERNIQKRFADKYNYDVVKDEPLKGRYEWVRLKP